MKSILNRRMAAADVNDGVLWLTKWLSTFIIRKLIPQTGNIITVLSSSKVTVNLKDSVTNQLIQCMSPCIFMELLDKKVSSSVITIHVIFSWTQIGRFGF